MLVLDTNILIEFEARNPRVVGALEGLRRRYGGDLAITAPTFSEFYFGFLRRKDEERLNAKRRLAEYTLLNTSLESSALFAELKHRLKGAGDPVSLMDLLIASIVIPHGGVLVTSDRGFKKIAELRLELIG